MHNKYSELVRMQKRLLVIFNFPFFLTFASYHYFSDPKENKYNVHTKILMYLSIL